MTSDTENIFKVLKKDHDKVKAFIEAARLVAV